MCAQGRGKGEEEKNERGSRERGWESVKEREWVRGRESAVTETESQ